MRRSSLAKLIVWGMLGALAAPAAVMSVLMYRLGRRRFGRILFAAREGLAHQRHDWFDEFTVEEFLTGAVARRPRR
jgi:hypothetical protein